MEWHEGLEDDLASKDYPTMIRTVKLAVKAEGIGEAALIRRLEEVRPSDLPIFLAAIGDCTGLRGTQAIRNVLAKAEQHRDVVCAALVALTKRAGSAATQDLIASLERRDQTVKDFSVSCLAAVGDGSAWVLVNQRLLYLLSRRPRDCIVLDPTNVEYAAAYLGRHIGDTSERHNRVAGMIRERWEHLHSVERDWFASYWPACVPGAEISRSTWPDPTRLKFWAKASALKPAFDYG